MAAYFLIDLLEITDAAGMQEYRKHIRPMVEKFGGRYLIAGGRVDVVEGSWRPAFPVLLEFPSMQDARRWYDSEDYRALKELRLRASRGDAVFIEGV